MADATTETVQAEVIKPVKGTVGISFKNPTPQWANIIFRVQFFANKAVLYYLAGTSLIPPDKIKQDILILASVDLFVWGIAKSIGVKPPENND